MKPRLSSEPVRSTWPVFSQDKDTASAWLLWTAFQTQCERHAQTRKQSGLAKVQCFLFDQ